jgi:hypothetical protein
VYKESNILRFGVSAVPNRETADLPKRITLFALCDLSPDCTLVPKNILLADPLVNTACDVINYQ